MKALIIAALLLTSCSTQRSYPVTGAAKKAERNQQHGLRHQFPGQ